MASEKERKREREKERKREREKERKREREKERKRESVIWKSVFRARLSQRGCVGSEVKC